MRSVFHSQYWRKMGKVHFFSNKMRQIMDIFLYFCCMIIPRDKYLSELRHGRFFAIGILI